MDALSNRVTWTHRLEQYFASTGEAAYCLSILHKSAEQRYSKLTVWIDLPCIALGVLNGATSIGSTSLFGDDKMAPLVVGGIALLTALLNTIGTYFGWSRRAEGHRISSLAYEKLYRFLAIEMSIPRDQRMSPSDLLKMTKDSYDRLKETSPLLPPEEIKEFKKRFDKPEYDDISKPSEANGIERIVVFNQADNERRMSEMVIESRVQSPMVIAGPSGLIRQQAVSSLELPVRLASEVSAVDTNAPQRSENLGTSPVLDGPALSHP